VSESVAQRYWPGQNPIGKPLRLTAQFPRTTVVVVAADTRYRKLTRDWLTVYFPAKQFFFFSPGALVVRTVAPSVALAHDSRGGTCGDGALRGNDGDDRGRGDCASAHGSGNRHTVGLDRDRGRRGRGRLSGGSRCKGGRGAVRLLADRNRRYGGGMAPIPFMRLFGTSGRRAVESIVPRRTFEDVILPHATRRALDTALAQVTQHDLIFNRWGLGERHPTGLALAFNFAGPPGTGKTICAEAIAHSLGRPLLLVRYAELESLWMGETPKNVAAIFRTARDERAVLLFDEADAIAARRSTAVDHGFQRESNTVVSVLLQELEWYNGVVIFATNLAANFDPAFERRIRTHVLFEMPGEAERALIWRVQLHPARTPLAADVDFQVLARRYEVSGGDIRNAVLKAALAAAAEPGSDSAKRIAQHHFEASIEEVIAGKRVMRQSLFAGEPLAPPEANLAAGAAAFHAPLVAYALAGAALLVALVALAVALLK
jgi:AAA+ superfamily predicted ATPase